MAEVTLLLDTNILWQIQLCERLTEKIRSGHIVVYIPTVVHAERIRQVANHYNSRFSIDVVRQFIGDRQFELLPLSVAHAEAIATLWLELKESGADTNYWHQHRFDILLCAIARATGYTLVVEDRGSHFKNVPARISVAGLDTLIASLPA